MAKHLVKLDLKQVQDKLKELDASLLTYVSTVTSDKDMGTTIGNRVDKMVRALCREVVYIIKMYVDYTTAPVEDSTPDEGDKHQNQLAFQFYDRDTKKVVEI